MSYLESCTTLNALTFKQVRDKLRARLDPSAYSSVPGKSYLTDIAPTSLWETLTNCFGPVGLGWGYTITGNIELYSEQKTSRDNREYTSYHANILYAEFWYAYLYGDELLRGTIPSTGSSENEDAGYAVRGALTSLIGGAARLLEWQFDIYAGLWKPGMGDKSSGSRSSGSTQKVPVGKPELFVMPFGTKKEPELKGKLLGEIERDNPGLIDWMVNSVTNKPDLLAAAKEIQAKRGAAPTSKDAPHWIASKTKTFWPWTQSLNGMKPEQVHEALDVESVKEFKGTQAQAVEFIVAWAIANLGYQPPQEPPDVVDSESPDMQG